MFSYSAGLGDRFDLHWGDPCWDPRSADLQTRLAYH